jgi:hypothetical protein
MAMQAIFKLFLNSIKAEFYLAYDDSLLHAAVSIVWLSQIVDGLGLFDRCDLETSIFLIKGAVWIWLSKTWFKSLRP